MVYELYTIMRYWCRSLFQDCSRCFVFGPLPIIQDVSRILHLLPLTVEHGDERCIFRAMHNAFSVAHYIGYGDVRCVCLHAAAFGSVPHSCFQTTFFENALFVSSCSDIQKLSRLVGSFRVYFLIAYCCMSWTFLGQETSKRL